MFLIHQLKIVIFLLIGLNWPCCMLVFAWKHLRILQQRDSSWHCFVVHSLYIWSQTQIDKISYNIFLELYIYAIWTLLWHSISVKLLWNGIVKSAITVNWIEFSPVQDHWLFLYFRELGFTASCAGWFPFSGTLSTVSDATANYSCLCIIFTITADKEFVRPQHLILGHFAGSDAFYCFA